MKKSLFYAATALSFTLASNPAFAVPAQCAFITAEISAGICTGTCITSFQQLHPECFGSTASTASSTQEINSTSVQQMLVISQAVTARTVVKHPKQENMASSAQRFGMAAGDSSPQWNAWASVSSDRNKYNRGGYLDNLGALRNNMTDSTISNAVIGGDYQLSPSVAAGVSAAFDSSSGTAESFNAGVSNGVNTVSTRGYSLAPYLGWQINQDWSMDATLGVGSVKLKSSVNGKADRLFYGANLNYANWRNNWQLTGKGSYLHGEEKYGNLTDATTGLLMPGTATNSKIDQLRVNGQAGYWMNDSVMPYLGLTYSADIGRSFSAIQLGSELGRTAFVYSLGMNFYSLKNSMTGGLSYNQEVGRSYSKNSNLMANINFRF